MIELDLEKVWFLEPGYGINTGDGKFCALDKLALASGLDENKLVGGRVSLLYCQSNLGIETFPVWLLNDSGAAYNSSGIFKGSIENHYKALRLAVDSAIKSGKCKIKDSLTVEDIISRAKVNV